MDDLVLATAALIGLSLAAMLLGLHASRRWPERRTVALTVVALAALLLFVSRYHGTWQIARVLPFSGAIVLGNWIPLGGSLFAGITLGQKNSPQWRRCGLASLILIASGYSVVCCFQGRLPSSHRSARSTAFQQQSRRSSCGACCAAAMLQHHGIEASEEEMLSLCLTSYRGCPALGLYRGLKLKTAGTAWDVEVVTCTVDELAQTEGPLLLRVLLPALRLIEGKAQCRTSKRRFEHAVLLLGAEDANHLEVFDPAICDRCRVSWEIGHLRESWPGEALRLVRRSEK
jgi:peptidase C39-like protein